MPPYRTDKALERLRPTLAHIHRHWNEPLPVSELARRAGWSRWQLQRVFSAHTGLSVQQYIRQLRLSQAAEALLRSRERQLDVALACGFDSEVSFQRSFKRMFGCSPGRYRRRGQRHALRTPILPEFPTRAALQPPLLQVRIDYRPAFRLHGVRGSVRGLFSQHADFHHAVPALWRRLHHLAPPSPAQACIGVSDVANAIGPCHFPYWAGWQAEANALAPAQLDTLRVPAAEYAVIPFRGPLPALAEVLRWFLRDWVPESRYRPLAGQELEIYPVGYDPADPQAAMEYWIPVAPVTDQH